MEHSPAEISLKRPKSPPAPPNLLADRYLRQLLLSAPSSSMDAKLLRSSIIIGVIAEAGTRINELLRLQRDDIDVHGRQIQVRDWQRTFGYKYTRAIPISDSLSHRFRLLFKMSAVADSLAVVSLGDRVIRSSDFLQRSLTRTQLRVGLTSGLCGTGKPNPSSAAFETFGQPQ